MSPEQPGYSAFLSYVQTVMINVISWKELIVHSVVCTVTYQLGWCSYITMHLFLSRSGFSPRLLHPVKRAYYMQYSSLFLLMHLCQDIV